MAAHGTGHPPRQLHSACFIYITQGSEHLKKDGRCWEPAIFSLTNPTAPPTAPPTSTRW